MINSNIYGLRTLALKTYCEIINECRQANVVTEEVK